MEKRIYPALNEEVFWDKLLGGLTVAVVPRPGFSKKLAYFVTDFGAIHTDFTLDGKRYQVPAGIAHYLEHKLFDMPGRDVTAEFAALGASPNAFTSYDLTAYYFSCTEHFDESLRLLLEFVSTPYFTEETVQKEQGIIAQEIGMYEDNPDSRIFEDLMNAMYTQHPVRVPILGTRESIAQITPELLHICHKAFYRPGNMLLCVVGDVDPAAVAAAAMEVLPEDNGVQVQRREAWQEEMTCPMGFHRREMEVAMPMFHLGFKYEPPKQGKEAVVSEIIGDLAAEALFGESSRLYMRLYEQGLIDSSFSGGFETIDGMALLLASGDSEDPEAVKAAIMEEARRIADEGVSQAEFVRMKRSVLGRRIRDLDSASSVAFRICAYYFSKFDYFDFPEPYREVKAEDLQRFLAHTVTQERCSLCIIEPKGGQ